MEEQEKSHKKTAKELGMLQTKSIIFIAAIT